MSDFFTNRLLSISFGHWVSYTTTSLSKAQEGEDRAIEQWIVVSKMCGIRRLREYATCQFMKRSVGSIELARTFHFLILLKKGMIALSKMRSLMAQQIQRQLTSLSRKTLKFWFKKFSTPQLRRIATRKKFRRPRTGSKLQNLVAGAFTNWRHRVLYCIASEQSLYQVCSVNWRQHVNMKKLQSSFKILKFRLHRKEHYEELFTSKIYPRMQSIIGSIYFQVLLRHSRYIRTLRHETSSIDAMLIQYKLKKSFEKLLFSTSRRQQASIISNKLDNLYRVKMTKLYFIRMLRNHATRMQTRQRKRTATFAIDLHSLWQQIIPRLLDRWEITMNRHRLEKRRERLADFHLRHRTLSHHWAIYNKTLNVIFRMSSRYMYRAVFHHSIQVLKSSVARLAVYSIDRARQRINRIRSTLFWKFYRCINCLKNWRLYKRDRQEKRQAVRRAKVAFHQAQTRAACRLVVQGAVDGDTGDRGDMRGRRDRGMGESSQASHYLPHKSSLYSFHYPSPLAHQHPSPMRVVYLARKVICQWRRFVATRRSGHNIREGREGRESRREGSLKSPPLITTSTSSPSSALRYGTSVEPIPTAHIPSISTASASSCLATGSSDSETSFLLRAKPRNSYTEFVPLPVPRQQEQLRLVRDLSLQYQGMGLGMGQGVVVGGLERFGTYSRGLSVPVGAGRYGGGTYGGGGHHFSSTGLLSTAVTSGHHLSSTSMSSVSSIGGVGGTDDYRRLPRQSHEGETGAVLRLGFGSEMDRSCSSSIVSTSVSTSSTDTARQQLAHELLTFIAEFNHHVKY